MSRTPPRRVEERSTGSRASYYREGRTHLNRALALYPNVSAVEALALAMEFVPDGTDPKLCPTTTRRYLEDHRVIIAVLVRAARLARTTCDPGAVLNRIEAALLSRRGRPKVARGATLRVKDATEHEARSAFTRLKALSLRNRAMTPAAAALYVLVDSRIGYRPIELCGAVVKGKILYLPNAKRADGQDLWRTLDLRRFPDILVEATKLLIRLAPEPNNPAAYERWRNGLALSLARASIHHGLRRLSLYSFRHAITLQLPACGDLNLGTERLLGGGDREDGRASFHAHCTNSLCSRLQRLGCRGIAAACW